MATNGTPAEAAQPAQQQQQGSTDSFFLFLSCECDIKSICFISLTFVWPCFNYTTVASRFLPEAEF